jgi:hypothetical protein
MKASEFRVGSYVDLYGNIARIIPDDFKKWVDVKWDAPAFNPIPLTEEWLVKFGCENTADGFIIDRFRLFYNEVYKFWYVLDHGTGTYLTKVEYVHEWQNCYFVLNGEELPRIK